MIRICEAKQKMIAFSVRPASKYVHLDNLLFDLKYDPTVVEIPVPRYFKDETDNLEVDLAFKEAKPIRAGEKKKKEKKSGKKGKKGKKKKKKDDDDEEKKEEEPTVLKKEKWIDDEQMATFKTKEPH